MKNWDEFEANETEISSGVNWIYSQVDEHNYKFRQFYNEQLIEKQLIGLNEGDTVLKIERWYDDGSLWISGEQKNRQRVGEWWYCSHNQCIKSLYKEGKKKGEVHHYNKDSIVTAILNYENGEKEGAFITYDSLGIELCKGLFKSDTISESSCGNRDIFTNKDLILPSFPGGITEIAKFMKKKLRYPNRIKKLKIEGTCLAKLTIATDGSVKDIEVIRTVDESLKNEVIRVINKMPTWEPGKRDGRVEEFTYSLPVKFRLAMPKTIRFLRSIEDKK